MEEAFMANKSVIPTRINQLFVNHIASEDFIRR